MRILLVKTSSMGDIVHALPVLTDIVKNYPDAKIDWLIEKSFQPLLNTHQYIHTCISIEWRKWRKDLFSVNTWTEMKAFYRSLQNEYDYIIDMQGLIKSAIPAYLAKSKATKIGGYANKSKQAGYEPLAKFFYTHKTNIPYDCHTITRNRLLCADVLNYTIDENKVDFNFKKHEELTQHEFNLNQPYIVFGHGTSRQDKEWPIDNWIRLGILITKNRSEMHILLPWGNDYEKHQAHLIQKGILSENPDANVRVLAPIKLDKIVAILQNACAFIGVDTGLSHIASALDIACIVIYQFNTIWRTGVFWTKNTHSLYQENTHTATGINADNVWHLINQDLFSLV
jgi:heptosyltransferase I